MLKLKIMVVALLTQTLLASKALTVSCDNCSPSTTCATGKCYKIVGVNLNYEVCTGASTCVIKQPVPINIQGCVYDFMGKTCASTLCFNSPNIKSANGFDPCNTAGFSMTGTCTSTNVCLDDFAYTLTVNGDSSEKQSCLPSGQSCAGFVSYTVTGSFDPCPGGIDSFGQTEKCCSTYREAPKSFGICTSSVAYMSTTAANTQLKAWLDI